MLGVGDKHETSYIRSIKSCVGVDIHRGQSYSDYVRSDAWICEEVSGWDYGKDAVCAWGMVESLHPVEDSRRDWIESGALGQEVCGPSVQRLLGQALGAFDASAYICGSVACQTSCGRHLIEFEATLEDREHINRSNTVIFALEADHPVRNGRQAASGGATTVLPSKGLVKDELLRDRPEFVCSVFGSRSRLRKVDIAKQTI